MLTAKLLTIVIVCQSTTMRTFCDGRFVLKRKLGAGSFGEVYEAEDTEQHQRVAVKLESMDAKIPQLVHESHVYTALQDCIGIAPLFWSGSEESFNGMAISLLGKSLADLAADHHLSLKTMLMLIPQMLSCVEQLHRRDLIHRDIKPENFAMGRGASASQVFIIDFGLAKRFRSRRTREHIQFADGRKLVGTARYASVAAMRGCEQSRRDDMEALGFVWLFLLRGWLPWMGLARHNGPHKFQKVLAVKEATSFEDLCSGLPDEFVKYFRAVRQLGFQDEPEYAAYRKMFRKLFISLGYIADFAYEWKGESQSKARAHSSARVKKPAGTNPPMKLIVPDAIEPSKRRKIPHERQFNVKKIGMNDSQWKPELNESHDNIQLRNARNFGRSPPTIRQSAEPAVEMPQWMKQILVSQAAPRKF
jgi:serine/threonine protein kinase